MLPCLWPFAGAPQLTSKPSFFWLPFTGLSLEHWFLVYQFPSTFFSPWSPSPILPFSGPASFCPCLSKEFPSPPQRRSLGKVQESCTQHLRSILPQLPSAPGLYRDNAKSSDIRCASLFLGDLTNSLRFSQLLFPHTFYFQWQKFLLGCCKSN